MLKPERMGKLLIAGHKKDLPRVIEVLHQRKVLHIVEHKKGELDIGLPLREGEEVSFLLVRIRTIIDQLGINRQPPKKELTFLNLRESKKDIAKLHQSVSRRIEELAAIKTAMDERKRQIDTLERLTFFKDDLTMLGAIKSLTFFIGEIKKDAQIKHELSRITTHYELTLQPVKARDYVMLAIEKSSEAKAAAILQKHGFKAENLEHIRTLHGTPKDILLRAYPEFDKLKARHQQIHASLNTIRSRYQHSLVAQEAYLSHQAKKTEGPLKMAVTHNTFLATGWLPEKNKAATLAALNEATKNRLAIVDVPREGHESVPVKLKNPALIKPFEFFLDLYSLPGHHEIDPTFFIFLGFPLFFGMMLGDIGYGLVSLALFIALRAVMPKLSGIINVMMLSSISTIVFGMVFGEFFGAEKLFGMEIPALIHRTHDIQTMIMLSVAIGIVHIVLGLLIGFYNEWHHAGLFKAINAKIGWIVLLAGSGILLNEIAFKAVNIPNGAAVGGVLVAISIIMLFIGEGIRGLIELPGIFGNILSYARLMALGVASASLAVVVNDLAGPMFKGGIVGIIAGVLILAVGHTINFILGLIGPFLHSLRLQYVEFFTKFYQGGGTRYIPFGTK